MRVPVVFVSLLLVLGASTSGRAADVQPPSAAPPIICDPLGDVWTRPDGALVIDRRIEKNYGIWQAAYRIDDRNGYWLYPMSGADVVVLAKPPDAMASVNVSIDTAQGVSVRACQPTVGSPRTAPAADASLDTSSIKPLRPVQHVLDPLSCEQPFKFGRVTKAVAPDTPPEAVLAGISGTVMVEVALDQSGAVIAAFPTDSPSPILNGPAVFAAEQTQYSPAFFRCRPIAARYEFLVEFEAARTR
jgi:hypothetical protein